MSLERPVPARGPAPSGGMGMAGRGAPAGAMPAERSLDFLGSGRRLLAQMRPERALLVGAAGLGALGVLCSVLGPYLLGAATNVIFAGVVGQRIPEGSSAEEAEAALRAAGDELPANVLSTVDVVPGAGVDFARLAGVLALAVLVYVLASAFASAQGVLAATVVQRTARRLREDSQRKLSRVPLVYHDDKGRGELLSRVTNDIDNIATTLSQTLSQLLNALLTVLGVLTMMIVISPLLALIALVTVPLSVVVAVMIGKRAQPQFVAQWRTTGRLNSHIEEMFTGHDLVSAYGRVGEAEAAFAEHNDELQESSFRAQFASGLIQPSLMLLGNLTYVLVAVVGALRVTAGALSIGEVQAFVQYSRQFSQPLTQVASMANLLQSGVASAERVFALVDAVEESPDPEPGRLPDPVRGRVVFDHIRFSYREDSPLIEDLSLTVEPGHTVAIVGPTGAGKTTLVNLLMRFYDVTSGRISVDEVDITEMRRHDLRALTGMVLQDTWLFEGTIEENIAYGSAEVAAHGQISDTLRAEIRRAAEAAHVDRFVHGLPEGYQTRLTDDGGNLSAGERQLITIARAFLARPAILILDEATSAVDSRTDVLIQRAMTSLRQGRTSFVIAHRLSTIRDADHILVMEHGAIVEHGRHDDLIRSDGPYARLYDAQFAAALVEDDPDHPDVGFVDRGVSRSPASPT
jgi:ATP-binding cassette subfamily B multidrug efflux pump